MSYAGPDARTRDGRAAARSDADTRTAGARSRSGRKSALRPPTSRQALHETRVPDGGTDWGQVAMFGTGLLLGIAVGAGAALLTAPRTGAETRAALSARVSRAGRTTTRRGRDAWDELREELREARRLLRRRKARRALERETELG